jgi:hypothetical protein
MSSWTTRCTSTGKYDSTCAACCRSVAIYGRGEAAELAYLSLRESGLEPVAIFDGDGGQEFLGLPVRPVREHEDVTYDLMIVATLERPEPQLTMLVNVGVPRAKLFPLRQAMPQRRRPAPELAKTVIAPTK